MKSWVDHFEELALTSIYTLTFRQMLIICYRICWEKAILMELHLTVNFLLLEE